MNKAPLFFNQTMVESAKQTIYADTLNKLENKYSKLVYYGNIQQKIIAKTKTALNNTADTSYPNNISAIIDSIKTSYKNILHKAVPLGEQSDTNYIFLYFVTHNLPRGLVGLLIAVIILAAWGSIAAALNSLASTSVVDIHQKFFNKNCNKEASYKLSWLYTLGWGLFCVAISMFATNMGSLIEAVNVIGSLFYGVILGVFLVAFFLKQVKANAVFWAAILCEAGVIIIYNLKIISFLWLNAIGALGVMLVAFLFQLILKIPNKKILNSK